MAFNARASKNSAITVQIWAGILLAAVGCGSGSEPCEGDMVRLAVTCAEGMNTDNVAFIIRVGGKTYETRTPSFKCGAQPFLYNYPLDGHDKQLGDEMLIEAIPMRGITQVGRALNKTSSLNAGCAAEEIKLEATLLENFVPPAVMSKACAADEHVVAKTCVRCPAGAGNAAGDDASGENTSCTALLCASNQAVSANMCVDCPAGTTSAGGEASGPDVVCTPVLCLADQHVVANACVSCPSGTSNLAGDQASGVDTACDGTRCPSNQHVVGKKCLPCPAGTNNAAGDDPLGANTTCEPIVCGANQRVVAKACISCPAGTTNAAGDSAAGADTVCDAMLCAANQRVAARMCVSCPAGTTNAAGDNASGADTRCDPVLCGSNQRVAGNACVACAGGTTNVAGDDASGANTSCDGTRCASNQRVQMHACVPCPEGTTNVAGDDASGDNTLCDPILCKGNQRVVSHACVSCPAGTMNAPGDDAAGENTACDAVLCAANQRVVTNACVSCPPGLTNAAGDDASGANTSCDDPCSIVVGTSCPALEESYIKAANADANDGFGHALALAGDTLVVGSFHESSSATGMNGDELNNDAPMSGAVYVFVRRNNAWTQQAYLKASNAEAGDRFGEALSLSGDTLVVGAPGEGSSARGVDGDTSDNSAAESGAAYVFVRSGNAWTQQAYLKASNAFPGDRFGSAVAISQHTLAVGASHEDSNATGVNGNQDGSGEDDSGSVYVFVRDGTSWRQEAYLKASNTGAGDRFGSALALSEATLAVAAPSEASAASGINGDQSNNDAPDSGAVYIFVRTRGAWVQQAYVKASNTDAGDAFGTALALSGQTLGVGAWGEDSNSTRINENQANNDAVDSGAVYVFVRTESNWIQQAYLKASNAGAQDFFGSSLALSGNALAVGAPGESSASKGTMGDQNDNSASAAGAAYVFVRPGPSWVQQRYVKASNTDANDQFGQSIGLSEATLAVAGSGEGSSARVINGDQTNNAAPGSGAVYVRRILP